MSDDFFTDDFKKKCEKWQAEYERLKALNEPRKTKKPGEDGYNALLDREPEVPSEEDLHKLNEELTRANSFVQRPLMKGTTGQT